ncbi:MAG: ROK family protein [Candidatus Krumholzibacteriia bacterium]
MSAFVGIDIGGTNTKLAVLDGRGRIVARDMVETNTIEGPVTLFRRLALHLPGLVGRRRTVAAAGVGCAGLIDGRGRVRVSPNLPGWENTDLARIATRHLGVSVRVDNDANSAAYGEYRKGCGERCRMLVCITLGTGVGGGIVDRGRILRGASNFAAEIGHMTIQRNGRRCKCGNRGCLEAYVGADALVDRARRLLAKRGSGRLDRGAVLTPKIIAMAARHEDPVAKEVFEGAARSLGTALGSVVNLLNPDVIALAGGVASGFDLMRKSIREEVAARAFVDAARAVTIRKATLGNDAAAVGAALLAQDMTRTARGR